MNLQVEENTVTSKYK